MVKKIFNWVGGAEDKSSSRFFLKYNPHDGKALFRVARSGKKEVDEAVRAARRAQGPWAQTPPPRRGDILGRLADLLKRRRRELGRVVCRETGRSLASVLGEIDAAVALGFFFAGEGQRLYGKTAPSGVPNRRVLLVREPLGVAALIVAANTPVANVAWKIFPALISGNAAVLKAAEDAPATARFFGELAKQVGLPKGVLNILQGLGEEAGARLVEHPGVDVISFTGSTAVGREIARKTAGRLCRLSLELGGKNPFVVCDDADLEKAVSWAVLSAFSNAGQRCSSAGRFIVFDAVYEKFKAAFLERTRALRVGPSDRDDLGPLVSERQMKKVLSLIGRARRNGARVLAGGFRIKDPSHARGFYIAPTVVESAGARDEISQVEVFGPVAVLYRVKNLKEAAVLANDSAYGLTSAVHTRDLNRAHYFAEAVRTGVVSVNGPTYGSEPHLPFGGFKQSGNGTREPGTEALDVYTELKNVYWNSDPRQI